MSLPRRILAGRWWMLTRRCAQRMFLLRPDETTNQIILYCLAEAAQRFHIRILLISAQSNHHHTVLYDPYGNVIEFTQHFHKMTAKALNVHWGRWENLFAAEEPSLVELIDERDLLEKLVYVATNPVKDGLVAKVSDWPGVNTLSDLLARRTITVARPTLFFREDGPMPAEVELSFEIPPDSGIRDADALLAELERRVALKEQELAEERARTGRQVLGRSRVLRQSWRDSPTSNEPRRGVRPRIAARNFWSRIAALQRNRAFQLAYRLARKAWLAGFEVAFPAGTYWLRRFARVLVEPIDAHADSAPFASILN